VWLSRYWGGSFVHVRTLVASTLILKDNVHIHMYIMVIVYTVGLPEQAL
jgi:hypothetical protein